MHIASSACSCRPAALLLGRSSAAAVLPKLCRVPKSSACGPTAPHQLVPCVPHVGVLHATRRPGGCRKASGLLQYSGLTGQQPDLLQIKQTPLRTLSARAMSSGGVNSIEERRLFETLNKIDALLLTQDLGGVDALFTKDSVFHKDGITLPMDLKGIDAVKGKAADSRS